MKNYYLTNIRDFRIWFEYKHLNWPAMLLSKKFDMSVSSVCKMVRIKDKIFSKRPIPSKWLEEETWSR